MSTRRATQPALEAPVGTSEAPDSAKDTAVRATSLAQLIHFKQAQPLLRHLFPTEGSLQWELRIHRRTYIEGGAIYLIAGRLLVDIARFEAIALRRGLTEAAKSAGVSSPAAPGQSRPAATEAKFRKSIEELRRLAEPFDGCIGVYFLFKKQAVIYIGQSLNVFKRVHDHRLNGVDFDAWTVIACDRSELLTLEQHYISAFRPPFNKTGA